SRSRSRDARPERHRDSRANPRASPGSADRPLLGLPRRPAQRAGGRGRHRHLSSQGTSERDSGGAARRGPRVREQVTFLGRLLRGTRDRRRAAETVPAAEGKLAEGGRTIETVGESAARYRLLAENSTDVIAVTDAAGILTYVSPACK